MAKPRRDQIYKVTNFAKSCFSQKGRKGYLFKGKSDGKVVYFSIFYLRQMMADLTLFSGIGMDML